jgi:UDP-N-acetylmuramoyl-tripeptide--D-alanyl-D-alanine ligase
VRDWGSERVAAAARARELTAPVTRGPRAVVIDSRRVAPGDLFVGLVGERSDGGSFAAAALAAGAWGVLVADEHAAALGDGAGGVVLAAADPLAALGALALAWRRELGAPVIAVTGSTGKTSTKDILAALLGHSRVTWASPANHNTEIGLPLAILAAPRGTQTLVLELGMRGAGEIALLTALCEPDVGVIVNIGAAHLERLGSIEKIAAAKAELLEGLADGATAVVPAGEPLLEPYLRSALNVVRFGPGGDVQLIGAGPEGVRIAAGAETIELEPGFRAAHLLVDLCAAVAAARAIGAPIGERLDVVFSGGRGELLELPGGVVVIDDCYNANPMSMRAALAELGHTAAERRIAVLGDMLELGAEHEAEYHRAIGAAAQAADIKILVTVGRRAALAGERFDGEVVCVEDAAGAAAALRGRLRSGDVVLVKGSRGVGLERVVAALAGAHAGAGA